MGQQPLGPVVDLRIGGDPGNQRGYLLATIEPGGGTSFTTPVCGSIEITTAFATCGNIGWLASTGFGTISSLG